MARATFKPGAKIGRLQKNLADPSVALKQIGVLMVAESQRAFKDQQFGGVRWEPRGRTNIFGIIADLTEGRRPPSRRFESRPVLRDTGRLSASIAFRVVGRAVEVGTVLPYAKVHQKGGKIESLPITDKVRTLLAAWLKKQSLAMRRRVGWLLSPKLRGKKLTGKVPARPFLGVTKTTRETVRRVVGVKVLEAN